jgi:hypothetical protein
MKHIGSFGILAFFVVCAVFMCVVMTSYSQTLTPNDREVLPGDIEIMFTNSATPVWINGADPTQTYFTVGTITYSGGLNWVSRRSGKFLFSISPLRSLRKLSYQLR